MFICNFCNQEKPILLPMESNGPRIICPSCKLKMEGNIQRNTENMLRYENLRKELKKMLLDVFESPISELNHIDDYDAIERDELFGKPESKPDPIADLDHFEWEEQFGSSEPEVNPFDNDEPIVPEPIYGEQEPNDINYLEEEWRLNFPENNESNPFDAGETVKRDEVSGNTDPNPFDEDDEPVDMSVMIQDTGLNSINSNTGNWSFNDSEGTEDKNSENNLLCNITISFNVTNFNLSIKIG